MTYDDWKTDDRFDPEPALLVTTCPTCGEDVAGECGDCMDDAFGGENEASRADEVAREYTDDT